MPHSKCGAFLWNYSIIHIEFLPERLIEQVIEGLKGELHSASKHSGSSKKYCNDSRNHITPLCIHSNTVFQHIYWKYDLIFDTFKAI